MSQEQIERLLIECGTTPTLWKRDEMMVCCPVHQEVHPSCGVSSEKQLFHCFSCGSSGNFAWMLFKSQPDQYKSYGDAVKHIEETYNVSFSLNDNLTNIKRYEDLNFMPFLQYRREFPRYKLAPFMSGKETYKYFFDRGFSKEDMKEYQIGRDLDNKTVTIPVFFEDGVLAGIIGRYISASRIKNERYKIYDHFERGQLLYPVDKFISNERVAILVEGQFDAIRLRSLGYTNALAKMGVELTRKQGQWLCDHCDCVINIGDNDNRGRCGIEKDREILSNRVRVLEVRYPDYGKDVCDWENNDIDLMIQNAHGRITKIKRYV